MAVLAVKILNGIIGLRLLVGLQMLTTSWPLLLLTTSQGLFPGDRPRISL